jgi:hypothetical protein
LKVKEVIGVLGLFQRLSKQEEYRLDLGEAPPIHGYALPAKVNILSTDPRKISNITLLVNVNEECAILSRKHFYLSLEKAWIVVR